MLKRWSITAYAVVGVSLLLALPSSASAQKGPIKVALLLPQTGPLAANGKDMINGMQLFFEEQGYRLAGREVKLIIEDDAGTPATGLTKLRGLVEGPGIHVLIGPLSAAVGYAVAPYIDGKKLPALFPIVSSEDITQRKRSASIVRTGWSSAQPSQPFGKWVYDNLGYRKIAMIGADFAFGWEVAAGFQRTFEESGGQIVQKLWPPLNTPDFAPYLAQLRRDVDAVYAVFSGADALRFSKQFAEAGLKGRLPLIGGGTFTDEHVLRTMGDEVLGVVSPALLGRAHHPGQREVRPGLRGQVRADPVLLLRGHLCGRRRAQGRSRSLRGRYRERGQVPRRPAPRGSLRRPARPHPLRRLR